MYTVCGCARARRLLVGKQLHATSACEEKSLAAAPQKCQKSVMDRPSPAGACQRKLTRGACA